MISVGIDVAEAVKGLDLVALNQGREIVRSHGRLTPEAVLQLVAELRPAVVCIDSPPGWSTGGRSRRAERALAAAGIHSFATGTDPGDHPFYAWMRVGAGLFVGLADAYPRYSGGDVAGTAAEIFPHATALLLAGRQRAADETKLQYRRDVLRASGVIDELPTLDRVDAALGALTGLLAMEGQHSWVGDPDEGVILLPKQLPVTRFAGARRTAVRPVTPRAGALPLSRVTATAQGSCECGCGAVVRARFVQGHDAKLKSRLLREAATGSDASATLRKLGWSR
jgi:predicted nuclease with RNAse H fold